MIWNAFSVYPFIAIECITFFYSVPSSYHVTTYSSIWKAPMTSVLHQITNQVKPSQTVGESKQKRKIKRLGGVM